MSARRGSSRAGLAQLLRLARFIDPYRGRLGVALAALVVAAGCVLALGQGLRHVIDGGFGSGDPALLNQALAAVVAVSCVLAVATYGRFYLMMSVGERVIADIRRAVFSHVVSLSPAWFDATRTGEVVSRLTNDTEQLRQIIGFGLSMLLRNLLMMVGAAVLLVITSVKLAALILLGIPATLAPILLIGRRVRRLSREGQDRLAEVSSYIDEAIHAIRTMQAYGHENADRSLFGATVQVACDAQVRRVHVKARLIALVMLIGFCAVGVILWIGGHSVMAGELTAGQLSAFVFYAAIVAGGAGTVSEVWGELQRAAGATERLMELLDTRPDIQLRAPALVLPKRLLGELCFDRVHFHYPSRAESAALRGLSFAVHPGERVALVGPSGAGKSTLLALLLRFYDPQAGSISIDGMDIACCDPRELRRHMALVPQEPVIFSGSLRDNVRYGRPDALDAEVHAACQAAHAIEFIEQLPQGFDTPLGERGVKLSGGQRQRVSIARALLADREILLLDEATSSLDAESERLVGSALERLARGRTTLVIAHRLATVQRADRIIVMERGAVHAIGTHRELMREGGLYAHLARLQFLQEAEETA